MWRVAALFGALTFDREIPPGWEKVRMNGEKTFLFHTSTRSSDNECNLNDSKQRNSVFRVGE